MKNRTAKTIIICIIVFLIAALVQALICYFAFFMDIKVHNTWFYNQAQVNSGGRMPEIAEFEPYNDLKFTLYNERFAIFQSFGYTLVADYDSDEYAEKKSYFMKKGEIEKSFTHGDFDMIRLKSTPNEWAFPKLAYYYGFNDDTNQIVFVRFTDQDIDGIYDLDVLRICRFDEAVK